MFDRLRNIFLPPPLIIMGAAALYLFAWSGTYSPAIPSYTNTDAALSPNERPDPAEIALPTVGHRQADLRLISARPLFNQSREPWTRTETPQPIQPSVQRPVLSEPTPQTQAEVTLNKPNLSLIGMIQDDQAARALVLNLDTLNEHWLEVGDIYQSWELVDILDDHILLRAEGEEIVVLYNR